MLPGENAWAVRYATLRLPTLSAAPFSARRAVSLFVTLSILENGEA